VAERPASARRVHLATVAAGAVLLLSGCGLFGDDSEQTSVFDAEPGMCFNAPAEVEAQIDELDQVPCVDPHDQEAYAVAEFQPPEGEGGDAFPGGEVLKAFADGACAQEFAGYVGVDYLDSELFFTYLLPSPRSWEQEDREVLCLVTGTGDKLEGSVKGTGR
jgi:hypothetical protein